MKARKEAGDLSYELAYAIDEHGECFYEKEELFIVIGKIEKLKILLFKAFDEMESEREEN